MGPCSSTFSCDVLHDETFVVNATKKQFLDYFSERGVWETIVPVMKVRFGLLAARERSWRKGVRNGRGE